jgi:uncharacterized protein (DUF1330 family)
MVITLFPYQTTKRFLARAAEAQVAEGRASSGWMVIVEFPYMQRIHTWYCSPDYAKALIFRNKTLRRRLIFVEGLISSSADRRS